MKSCANKLGQQRRPQKQSRLNTSFALICDAISSADCQHLFTCFICHGFLPMHPGACGDNSKLMALCTFQQPFGLAMFYLLVLACPFPAYFIFVYEPQLLRPPLRRQGLPLIAFRVRLVGQHGSEFALLSLPSSGRLCYRTWCLAHGLSFARPFNYMEKTYAEPRGVPV